jgi:polar amino acid transport system substrate-binding protein
MQLKSALSFVLFTCLFFIASIGQSQPIKELPLATVEFPPFHYKNQGRVAGFLTEIVETTVSRMGYKAKIDIYPSKRGKLLAESGKLAGIFAFTKKPERLAKYHFTRPLGTIRDVFFKRKDRYISWRELADLKEYLIGATESYNYAPVFMDAVENREINTEMIVSPTPEIIHLRKLVNRRMDMAICEISLCNFIIKKESPMFDSLDYIDKAIGPVRTFHLGISRNWPNAFELTELFNATLIKLEGEGVVQKIHAKYGIIPYKE